MFSCQVHQSFDGFNFKQDQVKKKKNLFSTRKRSWDSLPKLSCCRSGVGLIRSRERWIHSPKTNTGIWFKEWTKTSCKNWANIGIDRNIQCGKIYAFLHRMNNKHFLIKLPFLKGIPGWMIPLMVVEVKLIIVNLKILLRHRIYNMYLLTCHQQTIIAIIHHL